MTALKFILGGLAGTIVGWVAAAAATILLGGFFGLNEFEGQRSMTAIFGIGPLGGLAGLVTGLALAWRASKRRASP
ncbi:hypothetical protein [Hyphomicrobium sp.]|jgi:hypothetical protein|uniref:hypothetical protein n=1 Tax=Hyphomicrobium sp. TaxID=82 RepID=UPI003F72B1FA